MPRRRRLRSRAATGWWRVRALRRAGRDLAGKVATNGWSSRSVTREVWRSARLMANGAAETGTSETTVCPGHCRRTGRSSPGVPSPTGVNFHGKSGSRSAGTCRASGGRTAASARTSRPRPVFSTAVIKVARCSGGRFTRAVPSASTRSKPESRGASTVPKAAGLPCAAANCVLALPIRVRTVRVPPAPSYQRRRAAVSKCGSPSSTSTRGSTGGTTDTPSDSGVRPTRSCHTKRPVVAGGAACSVKVPSPWASAGLVGVSVFVPSGASSETGRFVPGVRPPTYAP